MHVAVIGAGIVGVSTAIWLQREGHQVTLIDRVGPAAGTSHGNAGVLAAGSVVPIPVPGLIPKIPGLLLDRDQPLFLRWSYLPRLLPFLLSYLANGRHAPVERISASLAELLRDSPDQHLALAAGTGSERFVKKGDYLYAYTNRRAFESDRSGWDLRRRHGFRIEEMDEDRLADYDPALAGRFGFAVRCLDHGFITDPGEYVGALARHVEENGGEIRITEVHHVTEDAVVETSDGEISADRAIVTAGIWSKRLVAGLGLKVPIESERGYHVEFHSPSIRLRAPVMVASLKAVLTPMENRLRCAGLVEFGGLEAPPSSAPIDLITRGVQRLFPDLTYDRLQTWMGHRPSTTDSLPVIGAISSNGRVLAGFGHQHVGLTAGPRTGKWLSGIVSGNTPNEDLSAFSPARFR
ncbi:MAG: FAD-dependent oxidoreductase [Rhodobacteraceae bacterium]|nr:FAD-dependent oxidoreductase [Paracoccaceae bacterium]